MSATIRFLVPRRTLALTYFRIRRSNTIFRTMTTVCSKSKLFTARSITNFISVLNKKSNLQHCGALLFSDEKCVELSSTEYSQIAEDTLQSICECFENVLEESDLSEWDVNYSNDVLTVSLSTHGVYVINKQTPNKQIWLSSPVSGPKRYDYINKVWIYKHDGRSLHQVLTDEISNILQKNVDFGSCSYGST